MLSLVALVRSKIYTATKIYSVASIAFLGAELRDSPFSCSMSSFACTRESERLGDNGTITGTMYVPAREDGLVPSRIFHKSTGLNEPSSTCRSHGGPRLPRERVCRYFEKSVALKHTLLGDNICYHVQYSYIKNYEQQKEQDRII